VTERQHYPGHDVTIEWTTESHALIFTAKEGTEQPDGSVWYMTHDEDGTAEFDAATTFLRGRIKWDGCSHIVFGAEGDDGYLHLCGGGSFASLNFVLRAAWTLAADTMATFDRDVAEYDRFLPAITK
jgi:hypothetical protein